MAWRGSSGAAASRHFAIPGYASRRGYDRPFTKDSRVGAYRGTWSRSATYFWLDAINMSVDRAIVLISDRPDRSRELADRLSGLCTCRTFGLHEDESMAEPVAAVITDVDFSHPAVVERLRHLLSKPRRLAAAIVAILRHDNYLERVQAAALGATSLFPPNAILSDISAALLPGIQPTISWATPAQGVAAAQNVDQARRQFGTIFAAVARGELVSRAGVDEATAFVIAAVAEVGIREWLEVVWSYDDATYQHCLLVTGLAAEFATILRLTGNDQKRLVTGALLHDLGKAKIPIAILNKPGALTSEEASIMRSHARIGYELLQRQGDYETELLEVVLRHHELLDGSGYPDGLAGPQIQDLVRLVSICDIYAALIERRSYKQPIEPSMAFKTLQEMEGKLEGALVRAFGQVAEKSAAAGFA
jgi:putative nucleotidyltransferase with HDIG domain